MIDLDDVYSSLGDEMASRTRRFDFLHREEIRPRAAQMSLFSAITGKKQSKGGQLLERRTCTPVSGRRSLDGLGTHTAPNTRWRATALGEVGRGAARTFVVEDRRGDQFDRSAA